MKQIAIYCVNYHSYDSLRNYLNSIETAVRQVMDQIQLSVFVADNSVPATSFDYPSQKFTLQMLPTGQNLGYFGAIRLLMQKYSPEVFDYSIISNVDIIMQADTLKLLYKYIPVENTGWIVPSIISQNNGEDLCPQAISRYSYRKLKFLWLTFRFPYIHRLYAKTLYKHKAKTTAPAGIVYAGHGSCIILTREYINRCGIINYPIFLYEEEIYVAEECRTHGLKAIYDPSITVHDIGRISTGKTNWKENYLWHAQGLAFILKKYY